ncbi:hypothetical protein D3C86_1961930 [compost metagenome]
MHDGAELLGLFGRPGIDGDQRDALGPDLFQRALQHVEVGNGDHHAVIVGGGRLFDQTRHFRDITGGGIAVVHLHSVVLARLLERILDDVPPGIGIGRMADQDVFVGHRWRGAQQ